MAPGHHDRILDQFSRQAVPFSQAHAIRNQDALNRIVQIAEAGPEDTVLDVACGPGLLACAFARVVQQATGIDITPAMLERARSIQQEQRLENVNWKSGDVYSLPYADQQFSIVVTRFSFHHLMNPLAALREMKRVCRNGGRVVVADMAPAAEKAETLNRMERLRDPSHVRAMPLDELRSLFKRAALPMPRVEMYRVEGELEDLLERSFPNPGDTERIRRIFEDSLDDDELDLATHRSSEGKIFYSYPVAVLGTKLSA
jgi:ubiquinone/menaquinone biosynthesis C-methylase UbiE